MTMHDVATGHEATADYSLLVSEATVVLTEMATADSNERAEELQTLRDIHAEGAEFVGMPGIPASLRSLFDSILALGERLADIDGPLSEATLAQIHVIESVTRAIAAALDSDVHDTAHVESINRGVAALSLATPATQDLAGATEAARVALEQYVAKWQH